MAEGECVASSTYVWVGRSLHDLQLTQSVACTFPNMKTSSIQRLRRVLRETGDYDMYWPKEGMGVGEFCIGAMISKVTTKRK